MRFLLSVAPLVAFYLLEPRVGLRGAVIASLLLAGVELAWARWHEGRWSKVTVASGGLIAVLGGLSLAGESPAFVLLTPAVGDVLFAVALVAGQLWSRGLLVVALQDQAPDLDLHPMQTAFLGRLTWRLAANLSLHAVLVVWSAGQSRETWLMITGPVAFGMTGAQLLAEIAWARLVLLPRVEADEDAQAARAASGEEGA